MKPRCSRQRNQALTLLEVLVVIGVLFVLFMILVPTSHTSGNKVRRIVCVNNLKQIGLAYREWAGGHNDKYPVPDPVTNGGWSELSNRGIPATQLLLLNFMAMSNELSSPRILHCPAETRATWADDFSHLKSSNISYFISPDIYESSPQMIFSGDDNLAIGGIPVHSGLLEFSTNAPIAWTAERHYKAGNIGLADGSVQQVPNSGLQQALQPSGTNTIRLAIP